MIKQLSIVSILITLLGCTKFKPEVYVSEPSEGTIYYQKELVHVNAFIDGRGPITYHLTIKDKTSNDIIYEDVNDINEVPYEIHDHFTNQLKKSSELELTLVIEGSTDEDVIIEKVTFQSDSSTIDSHLNSSHDHHNHTH